WSLVERQAVAPAPWWWGNTGERPGFAHFGKSAGYLAIDPTDPDHWFMTDWYAIWQTFDAGSTWQLTIDGIECTYILHLVAGNDPDGVVHMAMSDNGYFRSTDGGRSFHKRPTLPSSSAR